MRKWVLSWVAIAAFATALGCGPVAAQSAAKTQGITRTILETHDLPGTNYQIVLGISEIAPNASFPRHTHPGPETSYTVAGSYTVHAQGLPTRTVAAGQSGFIPAGVVHWGKAGPEGAKIVAVWVVEKGKPLASPAK